MTESWPHFPVAAWEDTRPSLQRWAQIVGKVRMALTPPVNHYWHVPLYVSAHGLTTSAIPYRSELFEISFDFLSHQLDITTSWRCSGSVPLHPISVAQMYADIFTTLQQFGIGVSISTRPN